MYILPFQITSQTEIEYVLLKFAFVSMSDLNIFWGTCTESYTKPNKWVSQGLGMHSLT